MKIELFKIEFSTQHCFCRTDQNFKKTHTKQFQGFVPQKAPMKCFKNLLYFWNKKITQIFFFSSCTKSEITRSTERGAK